MTAPKRIQRKRTKGWRMPDGAVYVGRPSKWGNPWSVGDGYIAVCQPACDPKRNDGKVIRTGRLDTAEIHAFVETPEQAVGLYESAWLPWFDDDELDELAGHDLACWCPLDQPCHADVLLEIANT